MAVAMAPPQGSDSSVVAGEWHDDRVAVAVDQPVRTDSWPAALAALPPGRVLQYDYDGGAVFRRDAGGTLPPRAGYGFLLARVTLTRANEVHVGAALGPGGGGHEPVLIDERGVTYPIAAADLRGLLFYKNTSNFEMNVGGSYTMLFVLPTDVAPKTLAFVYPYWTSWESHRKQKKTDYGRIDIDLAGPPQQKGSER
jgi:hypothetical protein